MGAAANQRITTFLQPRRKVAEFILTVEQSGDDIDGNIIVLIVEQRELSFSRSSGVFT